QFMGLDTMGRVVVTAKIENLEDAFRSERGELAVDAVRSVEVTDALVDSGATTLAMPKRLIEQLGLRHRRSKNIMTANGPRQANVFEAVRLTIEDRDCVVDVVELPDDCPTLIGQIPLESMDWVIDMPGQRLIGNPAHGGKWMGEIF